MNHRLVALATLSLALPTLIFIGCSEENPAAPAPDPVADFSWSGAIFAPATITFTNLSSDANQYSWNFGDGNSSAVVNPTHIYQIAGSFQVTLIALDSLSGKSATTFKTLVIERPNPVPDFEWSGEQFTGETLTFTNLSTNANQFMWEFGDGDSSSLLNPTHVYQTAGEFEVTLTAIDTVSGKSASKSETMPIEPPNPVADFTWTGSTATPAQLTFVNRSQNADRYQWDFGDGRTSQQASPVLTYSTRGTYSIMLIASNATTSRADTVIKSLTITPGSCYLEAFFLDDIPWTMPGGGSWDIFSNPDPQIDFCDASGNILGYTSAIQDVTPSDLPARWNVNPAHKFSGLSATHSFKLYDEDVTTYELMGTINFRMSSLAASNGYVTSYSLSSGSFDMRINVRWE